MEIIADWSVTTIGGTVPGTPTITGAVLNIDRYSGGTVDTTMTYPIEPWDYKPGEVRHLQIKELKGSLEGCTATLNFNVTVDGVPYSVQSPVYIDPRP